MKTKEYYIKLNEEKNGRKLNKYELELCKVLEMEEISKKDLEWRREQCGDTSFSFSK